jgi:hypothetical protein
MKQVTPYKTMGGAMRALDNGGRFFNLFTHAGDGEITQSEVSKAAGIMGGQIYAMLFFQLAISRLSAADQASLIDHLTGRLRDRLRHSPAKNIPIAQFKRSVELDQPVIVEGYPVYTEDRTQFTGFITVPMTVNNVTTMMMIPIVDQFDIYEVFQQSDKTGPSALIAVTKMKRIRKLGGNRVAFAGIAKEMEVKRSRKSKVMYVETCYYAHGSH